ncbi:diphthine--ammonia ligase-like isoform X2 [Hylaeus volcanicus]|uniref:diphthine--ammonia ligase-like isoform X2 n=1 Tax=Hylaeus volcanicus TaxID=313075 RepID=UPI0023B79B28|nr:diphthine--ammonia ligase-like isoform X2 [Hylaeus volcanicus]
MCDTARAVALISGGKDSLFTLHIAQILGYKIEILGHIQAKNSTDDIDSYMYQTVGSSCVQGIAECLSLPIKTHILKGTSKQTDSILYNKIEGDEVEDLYELLTDIVKEYPRVKYVITGAILSNYQRCRVENVCQRLDLVSLAFLWKMPQSIVLHLMTCSKEYNFILIKAASMGLTQNDLGQSIHDLTSKFLTMEKEFGFNCCGEGGEYETITLNSPLFKKKFIKTPNWKTKNVSDDAICSVCYLYLEDSVILGEKVHNDKAPTCDIIEKIYIERLYENRYYLLDLLGTLDYMKFYCEPENETHFYFEICKTNSLTIDGNIFFLSQELLTNLSESHLKKNGKNDNLLSFFGAFVKKEGERKEEPHLILRNTTDVIKVLDLYRFGVHSFPVSKRFMIRLL